MLTLKLNFWKDLSTWKRLCVSREGGLSLTEDRKLLVCYQSYFSPQSASLMFQDVMPIYFIIEFTGAWDLETFATRGNQPRVTVQFVSLQLHRSPLQFVTYILSLQIVTLYELRCNKKYCSRLRWNLHFWKNPLYWTWIWQDSQRWFKGPTPMVHWSHTCGTNSQKKLFHMKFSASSWN